MAIQNRRGVYSDFTPTKMVPGELAVVQSGDPNNTSGKAVYAAFGSSGDVKRLATEDDLSKKVDKVTGKRLSTNDYTDAEKTKLAGIATGAEVNVQSDWNQTDTNADDFIKNKPTKTSDFTNDGDGTSNFATESYVQQNGGKIDTISVNGTQQTITNKNVDIPVPVIDSTLTQTGKAADAKVTGDELENKAPAITNTASGSIAHFEDGSDANAKGVIARIEPVQDLHGYDHPWSAGGGKQLLNPSEFDSFPQTVNGITAILNSDGTFTLNGTATANIYLAVMGYRVLSAFGFLEPNVSYTLSGYDSKAIVGFGVYGSGTDYWAIAEGRTMQFTSEQLSSLQYRLVVQIMSGETLSNVIVKPMICKSSATNPAQFAPYSNICPISGFTGMNVVRTGKNLIPLSKQAVTNKGIQYTPNEDGSITINGTNDGTGASFSRSIGHVRLKPGRYKKTPSQNDCYVYVQYIINSTTWTTVPGGYTSSTEFTIEEGMDYDLAIRIGVRSGATVDNFTYYPYIYPVDETDLTFDPPKRDVINVTFPSEAGTVYGGYVDVTQGKLVVDRAMVDLGTLNWTYYSQFPRFAVSLPSAKTPSANTVVANLRCSNYKAVTSTSTASAEGDFGIALSTSGNLQIRDTGYSTAADFKTAMSGVQLVYELAESITYDITPQQIDTLFGVNNIWNDCNGDMDVEYKADTKLYIEQLTKPTEDDMVANGNIASEKFFMIGNRLFLSTASIAIGETIVPGTNCTELSLADALNNLNA